MRQDPKVRVLPGLLGRMTGGNFGMRPTFLLHGSHHFPGRWRTLGKDGVGSGPPGRPAGRFSSQG